MEIKNKLKNNMSQINKMKKPTFKQLYKELSEAKLEPILNEHYIIKTEKGLEFFVKGYGINNNKKITD